MRLTIYCFSLFLISTLALAAPSPKFKTVTIPEAAIRIPKENAKRIFVVGFSGQVIVTPLSNHSTDVGLRTTKYVTIDDAQSQDAARDDLLRNLVIKSSVEGDVLEIRAVLPPTRNDWTHWSQGKSVPSVKIEIAAPENMNLEIYMARGDVKVSKWRAPVTVTSQEGKIVLDDISGDVVLRSMFGADVLQNIKGAVNIENFSSSVSTSNISGKLKLRTFSGETHIKKVLGSLSVSSQRGAVHTNDTNGSLDLQSGVAPFHITEHRGVLRGHSQGGPIEARLSGHVDAQLSSAAGALALFVPRGSKADVSLTTEKGDVNAPRNLEHKRSASGKTIRGVLNGSDPGRVRLTSESGDLSLKVF